jgi:hypothetical protein
MAGLRYIDWVNETHSIDGTAAIDLVPETPMCEIRPKNIKLDLFPQQRVLVHALLEAEKRSLKGLNTLLPIFSINGLKEFAPDPSKGPKVGLFHSDLWNIRLRVGGGKTLVCLSIIAKSRVPDSPTCILGCDLGHASLMYTEPHDIPKANVETVDLAMDLPCFFSQYGLGDSAGSIPQAPCFPSYQPFSVSTVTPPVVWPINIYFAAEHLIPQIKEYCEDQIGYPWRVCSTNADLYDYIIELITEGDDIEKAAKMAPFETTPTPIVPVTKQVTIMTWEEAMEASRTRLKDLWLLLVPVRCLTSPDYHELSDRIDVEKKKYAYNKVVSDRLVRMQKMLESKDYSTVELIRLTTFIYGEKSPRFYSRIFFDDYDSLPTTRCPRIYSLKYYYVSGTDIRSTVGDFSFITKLTRMGNARNAAMVTVAPEKVTSLMNLSKQEDITIECTEPGFRAMIIKMLSCFIDIAKLRAHEMEGIVSKEALDISATAEAPKVSMTISEIGGSAAESSTVGASADASASAGSNGLRDITDMVDRFVKEISAGGMDVAITTAKDLDESFRRYGLSFMIGLPSTVKPSIHDVFSAIYRTFISQLMYTHLMRLSIDIVSKVLFKGAPFEKNMGDTWVMWKKYVTERAFPARNSPFMDLVRYKADPIFLPSITQSILMPENQDTIDRVLSTPTPISHILSPFLIRYLNDDRTVKKYSRSIDGKSLIDGGRMSYMSEQYKMLESILTSCITNSSLTCNNCEGKIAGIGYITSDCNTVLCDRCVISSNTVVGEKIQCKGCGKVYQSKQTILAVPFSSYLSRDYVELSESSKKSKQGPSHGSSSDAPPSGGADYTHSVYAPYTVGSALQFSPRGDLSKIIQINERNSNDKIDAFIKFVTDLRTKLGREPVGLLFGEYGAVTDEIVRRLAAKGIKAETFDHRRNEAYKAGEVNVILTNSVRQVTGFNMEYIDFLGYYHIVEDEMTRLQLTGRAMRIGRDKTRLFRVVTLIYPSEKVMYDRKVSSVGEGEKKRLALVGATQ